MIPVNLMKNKFKSSIKIGSFVFKKAVNLCVQKIILKQKI